jgi:Telomere resolvase
MTAKNEPLEQDIREFQINLEAAIRGSYSITRCKKIVDSFFSLLVARKYTKSTLPKKLPKAVEDVRKKCTDVEIKPELRKIFCYPYINAHGIEVRNEYNNPFIITYTNDKLVSYGIFKDGKYKAGEIFQFKNSKKTPTQQEPKVEPKKINKPDPAPQSQKLEVQVNDKVTALDVTKYLEVAQKLLESTDWRENCLGVEMAVPRRGVEVGLAMEFRADSRFVLAISTPAKKRGESGTFYRVPCLVDSEKIVKAVENIRATKPQTLSNVYQALGMLLEANAAFNNDENSRINKIFNDKVRPLLPIDAAPKQATKKKKSATNKPRNNQHQLKHIGTCILFKIKHQQFDFQPGLVSEAETWTSHAVAHVFASTTKGYLSWNITNIPEHLKAIADDEYGTVEPEDLGIITEQTIETTEDIMTTVITKLLELNQNDIDKINVINKLFIDEQGNQKPADKIASSLDVLIGEFLNAQTSTLHRALNVPKPKVNIGEKIESLIDAMILHNNSVADNLKIFISDSSIRKFMDVFPELKEQNITVITNYLNEHSVLRVKIDDHNQNRDASHNLKWRKHRQAIVDNLKSFLSKN